MYQLMLPCLASLTNLGCNPELLQHAMKHVGEVLTCVAEGHFYDVDDTPVCLALLLDVCDNRKEYTVVRRGPAIESVIDTPFVLLRKGQAISSQV